MLMEDATEAEKDLQALEILLGDKIAFTVGETAKILGRSVRWVLQKTASGKWRRPGSAPKGASPA
jgi:hypothetical protein